MTVRNLYELYKQGIGVDRRIILCDHKTQEGYEIRNLEDFDRVALHFDDSELYIMSQQDGDDLVFFEYFEMKQASPTIAVIRHPHLTNAYWKEKPDKINDIFSVDTNLYRYINVEYGWLLKENVIELPQNIDPQIWKLLQKRFPKAFYQNVKDTDASWSIVFSNTDRFSNIDDFTFKSFPLNTLYPDLKRPTIKSISQKFWKELKAVYK